MAHPALELHPEAVEEARAARLWYAERSPAAAEAFVGELEAALDRILADPDRFPAYLHGTRRCLLHRFPYVIVYRPTETTVRVVAVAHGRRKPGYWKTRSPE